jgi:hypothetical protein
MENKNDVDLPQRQKKGSSLLCSVLILHRFVFTRFLRVS